MQIWTSALNFTIVGEEVSVANAIRRPNEKRICVYCIDELRVSIRKGKPGNCWIIERKCGIKSSDSTRDEMLIKALLTTHSISSKAHVYNFYLFNLCRPDEMDITSLPMMPHMWASINNKFRHQLIKQSSKRQRSIILISVRVRLGRRKLQKGFCRST